MEMGRVCHSKDGIVSEQGGALRLAATFPSPLVGSGGQWRCLRQGICYYSAH
jgi:hypothetical protein